MVRRSYVPTTAHLADLELLGLGGRFVSTLLYQRAESHVHHSVQTNLFLDVTNWTVLGQVTDSPPGSGAYQFTDSARPPTSRFGIPASWP